MTKIGQSSFKKIMGVIGVAKKYCEYTKALNIQK